MTCNPCNHQNQVTEYPEGSAVMATCEIPDSETEFIPVSTYGRVLYHCANGRAAVAFDGFDTGSHTFHEPEHYIKSVPAEERAAKILRDLDAALAPLEAEDSALSQEQGALMNQRHEIESRLHIIAERRQAIYEERRQIRAASPRL